MVEPEEVDIAGIGKDGGVSFGRAGGARTYGQGQQKTLLGNPHGYMR